MKKLLASFLSIVAVLNLGLLDSACLLCAPGAFLMSVVAQEASDETTPSKINSGLISALKLRSIGPALMSGRIADIAIDPTSPNTWFVAAGSGNVWKTVNAGTTWEPIFENYGSYSIGCVTLDPNDSSTVWIGTGENVGGRHCGFGDGVYKSIDGGQTFRNMGLKSSEHLAKIIVDPRDSDLVYVASQGPLWSVGGERGLYKSTDGGKTWSNILSKGKYTGVTDVVIDPSNPDVLYAATHQRHRTVWALLNGGPESGIHKSTDGGQTWRELKKGLPGGDKGKIALGVSPMKTNVVYATIELPGRSGGFWKSTNGGASWAKQSGAVSGGTGPHYYQELYVDPHRFDVIYQADVQLGRSVDGGQNFESVEGNTKHVDNHAVAFHPTDADFLLVGCDGGLYKSYDRGNTYAYVANLPLTQFYKIDVDYDYPFYHVVGGTQDNYTQYGPAATSSANGIRNSDWRITIGGDGHDCAIDPEDPNTIYCESQQGFLRRFDRRTGESVDIRPQPEKGEEELRFNWDSPIHISPHSHTRIYFGSKRLHRSDDRGDSWVSVSGDLSRNQDRYKLRMMNRVWSIDATYDLDAMSQYGNITSISESPVVEGLIYIGTDDGLIQVTEDSGENWRKIDKIFGVPEYFFVNDIKADRFDADTVYVCLDNHKTGDYKPYIVKSTDRGRTWVSIAGDIPDRHLCWRMVQDHVAENLLFAATEFGIYVTINGGENWLKLSGAPVIPFRDLEIQRRENDLVAGSFGRGIYVLDDYTPLRELSEDLLNASELKIFPIKHALLYRQDRTLGGGGKAYQGDSYFTASNPDYGAVITYYLKESLKSKESKRKEAEAKVKSAAGNQDIPSIDELREEEREEGPSIRFAIRDSKGDVVKNGTAPSSSGIHRISWNFAYTTLGRSGPSVVPGKYTVSFSKRLDGQDTPLGEPAEFEVGLIDDPNLDRSDRVAKLAYQKTAIKLFGSVQAASRKLQSSVDQIRAAKTAIESSSADRSLYEEARRLELALLDLQIKLEGDRISGTRGKTSVPSVSSRAGNSLFGTFRNSSGPTETQRQQYKIAKEEFEELLRLLNAIIEEQLPALNEKLDAAGVPWTIGRKVPTNY